MLNPRRECANAHAAEHVLSCEFCITHWPTYHAPTWSKMANARLDGAGESTRPVSTGETATTDARADHDPPLGSGDREASLDSLLSTGEGPIAGRAAGRWIDHGADVNRMVAGVLGDYVKSTRSETLLTKACDGAFRRTWPP
jgi:hypothetical protein